MMVITSMPILMLCAGTLSAQEEPSACVELGGLAYDNWTKVDSGGSEALPDGVVNQDYIRCKACHGWDHMGTDGGYVRRSRKETRPNAGAGDGDSTSRNISLAAREGAPVSADTIWHQGTGRAYSDGTGSWVALDETHSAANKAAHQNGYSLGNQHPDFSTGGMTQEQADCLAEFLNFEDAAPSAYFANIDPSQNPVLYTIVDTADAAAGEAFFNDTCVGCHNLQFALDYLEGDGKFSELSQKARWGIPDTAMTRANMGNPTSQNVADMLLYLQQTGGTGFAVNPGLTGTWWNGPDRDGEGFPLQVGYAGGVLTLFGFFYTYDSAGNQAWLTAVGKPVGDTVEADLFITEGRVWGDGFNPADGSTTPWGKGIFTFDSCTTGTMALSPNDDMQLVGYTDLAYDLIRFDDFVVSGIACPTPAN
ncbi:MAG: hypothetical protein RQ826_02335 [Xanthomonadales bacterium]|nr:hypothetical protein [Xanthomonadales bacterium]